VRLEGFGQLKNPKTSTGIELATFQLVGTEKNTKTSVRIAAVPAEIRSENLQNGSLERYH
jgi:hypothetical protein